jgi:sarcosine oxidase, subunit alpha
MSADQKFRLAEGGRIDRDLPLTFKFNNVTYKGYQGDTLASALLANGVRVVGRSFKYHRPRGIITAGVEEANALVRVGKGGLEEPNVRATVQPLYDGLEAQSQNCWPSVNFDLGRWTDFVHAMWPAGFYNKTFMWPNWHLYEGVIRRAAGLGKIPPADDPDHYLHRNAHCDVLICGAGPAGLTAALAAAKSGARVILVEQDTEAGGSLLWDKTDIDGNAADVWLNNVVKKLIDLDNLTLLTQASASAFFDHNLLLVTEKLSDAHHENIDQPRERLWKIRAREVILATGAIEQPLVFPYNDRPGIMLASAVQHYLNRYAVNAGQRLVLATNNNAAYQTALDLLDAGVTVECIIDSRASTNGAIPIQVRERGVTVFQNSVPIDTSGDKGIRTVKVARRDLASQSGLRTVATMDCDCMGMSGGFQPAIHLFSQARGKLRYDNTQGAFVPDQIPAHVHMIGAAAGERDLNSILTRAFETGVATAKARDVNKTVVQVIEPIASAKTNELALGRVAIEQNSARQWIDFQHDVTLSDIHMAVDENFVSVEHLKRYTTTGMSVDQGKTSNINALIALADYTGRSADAVGTTTFRPFYMPVTLGALAGRQRHEYYAPRQRSPLYACHESLQAEFWDYGTWHRPAAYPLGKESLHEAVNREARATRQGVGLFDGSPLGKIEVSGPDAAKFLNRLYVNNVLTLKVGRARYGLMLNENGIVIDDGIFARLAENRFLVHTTSGGASRIFAWMEEWSQGEWPELEVLLTSVSSQWANIAVSGPDARRLLEKLECGIDLSNDAFPHMSIREGTISKVLTRIMRASFTGELGYEINVPADYGALLWQRLLELGAEFNITPIGIETLMVLRTEKGYLHVGGDTDGNTTPADIGWGVAVQKKQSDFIGKRSLSRPNNIRDGRLQYIGLTPEEGSNIIVAGAHVINESNKTAPAPTQGYVTSACYSPNLNRWLALGLVKDGQKRMGERINIFHKGVIQSATITQAAAYDPEGECLHA